MMTTTMLSTARTGGGVCRTTTTTVVRRSLRKSSSRRHSYVQKFSRASASSTNTSSGECELVECEANFGEEGEGGVKGAKINGKEISASAMRRLTLTNQFNEQVVLPQTENKKDVVVYLRHLG